VTPETYAAQNPTQAIIVGWLVAAILDVLKTLAPHKAGVGCLAWAALRRVTIKDSRIMGVVEATLSIAAKTFTTKARS
jgi:hypothetical protein